MWLKNENNENEKYYQPDLFSDNRTAIRKPSSSLANKKFRKNEEITIYHRKTNFGILKRNVAEMLDRKNEQQEGIKCHRYCHNGTKWVHHGLMNITQSIQDGQKIDLPQFPDSAFDVLNETEIYAFLAATWLGKFFRDESTERRTSEVVDLFNQANIDRTQFSDLMARIIKTGENFLSPHWQYDIISMNPRSNPYIELSEYLMKRLSLVPEKDQSIIKQILKSRCINVQISKRGLFRPGFESKSCFWRKRVDGTHITKNEIQRETIMKGNKKVNPLVNNHGYAQVVYRYFKEKEELWFPWKDKIELI